MKRLILAALATLIVGAASGQPAEANQGAYSGFPFGYGFYQPYGIRYSTSVRTPPYFAVNPPVYYGARHYRPYGASPFASLPLLEAGKGYRTRAAVGTPLRGPAIVHLNPHCESCIDETPQNGTPVRGKVLVGEERRERIEGGVEVNPFAGQRIAEASPAEAR